MSDDYGQKLDGEYRQRARVSYIREHAHHVASALVGGMVSPTGMVKATGAAIAQSAVEITGALHDALPPDPDQGQDGGSAPSGWERAQRPAQGLVEEHTVPADLDEGPIIEQEVARIDHSLPPEQLVAMGRDVECVTLARAIQWHAEHRVLMNGKRTVVFR